MTLINLDNSTSIYGTVRSIKLSSPSHGERYIDLTTDDVAIDSRVLDLAHGDSKVRDARYVASLVKGLLSNPSRELYSLQRSLNYPEWQAAQITATVEFAVEGTGHGEIENAHHNVLLVKTTWQM